VNLVEFFVDGVKIGDSAVAPYSAPWTAPALGSHVLTASAAFSGGSVLPSPAVRVSVLAPAVPSVQLTGPTQGSVFVVPTNVTLQATVAPAGQVITAVDFYVNDEFVSEDTAAPYVASLAALTPGPGTLLAVALDGTGNTYTSAPVHVTFQQPVNGSQII